MLEGGLNRFIRRRFARPGAFTGPNIIRWTWTCTGEEIASGIRVSARTLR